MGEFNTSASLYERLLKQLKKVEFKGNQTRIDVIKDRVVRFEKEYIKDDPEVKVALEIRSISNVDPQTCGCQGQVRIHAEWIESSFIGIPLSDRNYEEIKVPQLEPSNAIEIEHGESVYPKSLQDVETGLIHMTSSFQGEFSMKVNEREIRAFPLDTVEITIVIRPTLEVFGADFGFNITYDPSVIRPSQPTLVTFFRAHEFYLCEVKGRLQELNGLKYAIRMQRQYAWFGYKIVAPTISLQILSWAAGTEYAIDEFDSRINWLLTVFLAQSALLYVVSESIPRLAYLTLLDKFLSISAVLLFADMLEVWLANHFFNFNQDFISFLDTAFHMIMPMVYCIIMYSIFAPAYKKLQNEPKPIDDSRFLSGQKVIPKDVLEKMKQEVKNSSIPNSKNNKEKEQ